MLRSDRPHTAPNRRPPSRLLSAVAGGAGAPAGLQPPRPQLCSLRHTPATACQQSAAVVQASGVSQNIGCFSCQLQAIQAVWYRTPVPTPTRRDARQWHTGIELSHALLKQGGGSLCPSSSPSAVALALAAQQGLRGGRGARLASKRAAHKAAALRGPHLGHCSGRVGCAGWMVMGVWRPRATSFALGEHRTLSSLQC